MWDYKSGSTYQFDRGGVLACGTKIQHAIYARAVEKIVGGRVTRSGYLFPTSRGGGARLERKCTDQDMTTVRFVAGAGGEGQALTDQAPGDLAFTISAGEQIVINHHYINASPKAMDAQTVVNLYYADPGAATIPSGALAIVDTNLHLAPGTPTKDIHCTMQDDLKVWFQIPVHDCESRSLDHWLRLRARPLMLSASVGTR